MTWTVTLKKKVAKDVKVLPKNIRDALESLIDDLTDNGPVRGDLCREPRKCAILKL